MSVLKRCSCLRSLWPKSATGSPGWSRTGPLPKRHRQTTNWLDIVVHLYGERVIPLDIAAARLAGTLMDGAHATGQSPGFADLAVAATAASRNLTVLTRNVPHFLPLDVRAINPFE